MLEGVATWRVQSFFM